MKSMTQILTEVVSKGFEDAGFDPLLGQVNESNRPDLCEFQCNGSLSGAKRYKKNPMDIAAQVAEQLQTELKGDSPTFSSIDVVRPGFLNLKLSEEFLSSFLNERKKDDRFGIEEANGDTVIVDYGGPNVAKPLHIGHLRSAIIGESVKRLGSFLGYKMVGDIHMGDWGLQMGLIIAELHHRKPDLPYFDSNFNGDYPSEPPFTLSELEEIYPMASEKSKTDAEFKNEAMDATFKLQHGDRGCLAIWKHIMDLSKADLKKNYDRLHVSFELWKGEADADPYIAPMVEELRTKGIAIESEGALVIDVTDPKDAKEVPPCMVLKSDGAALYTTTDLATLVEREKDLSPKRIIYVVDKRQELHFVQVFRAAKKAGIVREDTELDFLGFGTMNGKDGKPFKTREGGVMRLETLLGDVEEAMLQKMKSNENISLGAGEIEETAKIVALSAIKYGDLSNQASKDYVFDLDKFTSFEGNTGPYILYTIVRIKSILRKYEEISGVRIQDFKSCIRKPESEEERALMLKLAGFNEVMNGAYKELAPHRICSYIFGIANEFNRFYHGTKIITEADRVKRDGWISLLILTRDILEKCIDVLGFEAPERM